MLAIIQAIVPAWGAHTRDPVLMGVATTTAQAQLAFAALSWCYLTSDVSVANVCENSHSAKPLVYKLTGVWGNHEGSMLLWSSS